MNTETPFRNILCIRLDAFGDVLMTEPALRALRESFPSARLTLLTSPAGAQAAGLIDYLDEVLVYQAPWMKHSAAPGDAASDRDFIERLRAKGFDAAIVFTVYSQNPLAAALMCYLADIPRRFAHCRENPYHLLTDWIHETEPEFIVRHEVERQLALVSALGASVKSDRMRIRLSQHAADAADAVWKELARRGECCIVVHPGATAASRRYPADRFAAAMGLIRSRMRATFIVTGSTSEIALADEVVAQAAVPALSLAGKLNPEEWAALIASAELLISNNTAAVHVAAATDTPVVDLYALTNPQHTPWRVPSRVLSHEVPCKNCYKSVCPEGHHRCLMEITPDEVATAAVELLIAERIARLDMGSTQDTGCCVAG